MFVVILTASVSSGDLQRLTLPISEGQSINYAYKDNNTLVELPFTVELIDFKVDYFVPKLIVFEPNSRLILNEASVDYSIELNKKIDYKNWEFKVLKYYTDAYRKDSVFIQDKDSINTEFAALIEAKHGKYSKTVWLSSGNYMMPALSASLSNDLAISLSLPEDKKYVSTINLTSKNGQTIKDVKIVVNFPFKFEGFNIYQQGFDDTNADNVDMSVLELVKDPWLPIIYVGMIMLLIGAILLFWLGKKQK